MPLSCPIVQACDICSTLSSRVGYEHDMLTGIERMIGWCCLTSCRDHGGCGCLV